MRCLLLAVVAGLAVLAVSIRAEEAVEAESVPETVEVDFDLDDDTVARMLGDLFDDDDFEEALEQQESNREARARGRDEEESAVEEKAAPVDPKDQARYNSFIDTFFRRLNSYARSRFDPLSIGLVKKEGRKAGGKGGKGGKEKGGKDKKKDKKKGKGKKDGKDGKDGKKDKKEKGGKKKGRHPKDLDLDEIAEDTEVQVEEVSAVEAESEVHDITKREVEFDVVEIVEEEEEEDELDLDEDDEDDEESLSRVTRDAEEEDPSDVDETNRRGKPAKGGSKKGKTKKGGKKKGKGKGKGKGKKGKKDKKGKKKGGKKGGKKSKRSAKSSKDTRTSRASVTGIATLRRKGDVSVKNKKGGKEMRAQFSLGPVDLKVSRKYSGGKDSVTKDARAVSPELTGKLSIHVDQNGKARMTNFRINRPAIVQVEGSLKKNIEKGGKSDNNFMEKSISRFSPVASKKLKAASREILSAGEPKAQSN